MIEKLHLKKLFAGAILLIAAGCAAKLPPPEFIAADYNANAIEQIAVLSVVDDRIDTEKEVKLDKWVKPFAKRRLKKAGYEFSFETDPQFVEAVSADGLEDEDPEMISSLGPDGNRWLLLLVLHDSSSKMTFGSAGAAEMTGYLFDKEKGVVVWRNKEFAEISQGGLMGMALKGVMQRSAIEMTTDKILQGLPKREKD